MEHVGREDNQGRKLGVQIGERYLESEYGRTVGTYHE
jgi:hypothetical protein